MKPSIYFVCVSCVFLVFSHLSLQNEYVRCSSERMIFFFISLIILFSSVFLLCTNKIKTCQKSHGASYFCTAKSVPHSHGFFFSLQFFSCVSLFLLLVVSSKSLGLLSLLFFFDKKIAN